MSKDTDNAIAEFVPSLSQWLKQTDDWTGLRWLDARHMEKFKLAIDWDESEKLKKIAADSAPWGEQPKLSLVRRIVEHPNGGTFVVKLANFQPGWIAKVAMWEPDGKTYNESSLRTRINTALISTFVAGNMELDALFRLPWANCDNPTPRGEIWQVDFGRRGLPEMIIKAIAAKPAAFELELGFSCGTRIASEKWEANIQTTRSVLDKFCPHKNADVGITILPMTKLWALLAKLAEYERNSWQHKLELTGLHAELNQFTSANPDLWARALPWLLPRMAELGQTVEAITFQLANINSVVMNALVKLTSHDDEAIRLKARGLQSFFNDNSDANFEFPRALADAAARFLDGTPMFPQPLTPLSKTWLGAGDVETVIADGIVRACNHFARDVVEQGGDIEEALTKALIKELETAFRDSQPRIQLFGKHPPILTAKQRPISKSKEEPTYGCDLAWLITGNVTGRFEATWVDLVQVKKSLALVQSESNFNKKTARADSWKIESAQLDTILLWSQTATYWMIAAAGEVLVIPAKHLAAIRRGTGKLLPQKTFNVGYHEVRSAAIPLSQYLTELLIGQWLGTTTDAAISFAQGCNPHLQPRMVIELQITGRHKDG